MIICAPKKSLISFGAAPSVINVDQKTLRRVKKVNVNDMKPVTELAYDTAVGMAILEIL